MPGESAHKQCVDVSVIVPLEFHRGLAIECIEGWATSQTYPRDRYQIVIAAPPTLNASIISKIQHYLQPWDRLEYFPFSHDMPLVAAAAKLAEGELLLFTESHCLPEPNALSQLMGTAAAHPEWAAFSSATAPITHSLLSEVEAQIYDSDIRDKLTNHVWLKVLDQCFLIRRSAYFACDGFEPEYGHFAEWLFSARLRLAGLHVGFDMTPVIRHYYIGDQSDLEEFTLDFAYGQIKFAAERQGDARAAYFPYVPELEEYRERTQGDCIQMARLRFAALPRLIVQRLVKRRGISLRRIIGDLANWLLKAVGRGDVHACVAEMFARRRLDRSIRRHDRTAVRAAFIEWFARLVCKGRLRYLRRSVGMERFARNPDFSRSGRWEADNNRGAELFGFYERETVDDRAFRWSTYCACVYLPLHQGQYRVRLDWESVRDMRRKDLLRVEFDGHCLSNERLSLSQTHLAVEVTSEFRGWHRLSWTVLPLSTAIDWRLLGLPLSEIRWFALDTPLVISEVESALVANHRPVYFLHIHKCAGTTTRLLLDNAFSSRAIFEPYGGGYYPEDLPDNPGIGSSYKFYRGHFGWQLPQVIHNQDLMIVTILREPIDRIVSYFHYLKQYGRIENGLYFNQWIEHFLAFRDTVTSHFVAEFDGHYLKGSEDTRSRSFSFLPEASSNLSKCLIIGLSERWEDTINLFAWQLGFLPPMLMPRNNPTLVRTRVEEIPDEVRARIEHVLEADIRLYQIGQGFFQAAMENMLNDLPTGLGKNPETMAVRSWLRQRYIQRMAENGAQQPEPTRIEWLPDDVFHGENLHDREQDDGVGLRWTGPNETTRFLMYIGYPRSWKIKIRLHAATPPAHAKAARLRINGSQVPVQIEISNIGYTLSAHLPNEVTGLSDKGVASFEVTSPVSRGESEFRMLGLAVLGMTLWVE